MLFGIKRTVLLQVSLFLSLLVFTELVFRLIEPNSLRGLTHEQFRLTRPEPYSLSAYFSESFIKESFYQPGGYLKEPRNNIIRPKEFQGNWFNVHSGVRVTTNQPYSPTRPYFLFGESAIYGSEVPDDKTIASQLQKQLNDLGVSSAVFNFGVSSVDSRKQLERLKHEIKLTSADTVVFYDGVNDVVLRLILNTSMDSIAEQSSKAPWIGKCIDPLISCSGHTLQRRTL